MSAITEAIKRIAEKLIIQGKDGEYKKGVRRGFFISIGILKEEAERKRPCELNWITDREPEEKDGFLYVDNYGREYKMVYYFFEGQIKTCLWNSWLGYIKEITICGWLPGDFFIHPEPKEATSENAKD